MKPLRIEQRHDEPADIWAMRAYAMALPHFSDDALRAMAGWIEAHSKAELERRERERKVVDQIAGNLVALEAK